MRSLLLCICILTGCSKAGEDIAGDVVRFTAPDAKCNLGFHRDELSSTACVFANGVKVYCTASPSGFVCSQLNTTPTPAPAATDPAHPPTP